MNSTTINRTAVDTAREHQVPTWGDGKVSLRRFPYPYKAAIAICSDIDETKTTEEFLEIQQFLNTKNTTSMGEGVGLEIGNSIYFYDDKGEFSYFTHDEHAKRVIIDMIRAGYIDCLHSYGDGATSRDDVLRALDVLHGADCKLDVWINHYGARSNLGRKFEYRLGDCRGDDPGSDVYHADVTLDYGIRFVWVGAGTRIIGQSAPSMNALSSLATVFDPRYPLHTGYSVAKELSKSILGRWGDERFIFHRLNNLTQVTRLEDGQKVYEFVRHFNDPVNGSQGATSRGLAYVISKHALDRLRATQGFMIVYTHLGKNSDCQQVIARETQEALRNLEQEYRRGRIYVTTTSKILNYHHSWQYLVWSHQQSDGLMKIYIDRLDDPVFGQRHPTAEQLQGLTFFVPDSRRADVYLRGVKMKDIRRNPPDESGVESISIPFTKLQFPY